MQSNARSIESNRDHLVSVDRFLTQIKLHQKRLESAIASRMDSRLSSRLDPADVVQEVLLRAVRQSKASGNGPGIAVYPWLYKIAMNYLIDLRRRHLNATCRSIYLELDTLNRGSEFVSGLVATPRNTPSKRMELKERDHVLCEAVAQLSPADRVVIRMRVLEERPVAEVARKLRCTRGAVKSRQHRVLKRLRQILRRQL